MSPPAEALKGKILGQDRKSIMLGKILSGWKETRAIQGLDVLVPPYEYVVLKRSGLKLGKETTSKRRLPCSLESSSRNTIKVAILT